jgi:hypothetical protein
MRAAPLTERQVWQAGSKPGAGESFVIGEDNLAGAWSAYRSQPEQAV